MPTPAPIYRLVSADLLRTLMQRTGTGAAVSIRELAEAAGVAHGTIGNLRDGTTDRLPADRAHKVARRLGVDLLILWEPLGRATGDMSEPRAEAARAA